MTALTGTIRLEGDGWAETLTPFGTVVVPASIDRYAITGAPGTHRGRRQPARGRRIGSVIAGYQPPAGWRRGSGGSVPAGACASRQVTPSGPTNASWRVPGREVEAVPDGEVDGHAALGQPEPDRALGAHQHLVVVVRVGRVPVAGPVGPAAGREALVAEPIGQLGDAHPNTPTPITVPIA